MKEKGQVLVLTIVVTGLVLMSTLTLVSSSITFFQNSTYSTQTAQAVNLAEAGVDKALASLNKSGGSYVGEEDTPLGPGTFSVNVTTSGVNKIIQATGYIPNKTSTKLKRSVSVTASQGTGVSFKYGIQVGDGGLELGANNGILGSVYSNGNITAVNNNEITGDVWIAGGTQPTADQEVTCVGVNCSDFIFGKNVSGEDRLDVAQSFKPSEIGILNKVAINIKKTGSPPDITVRLLSDNNGKPDKNGVLASGTLYASLVTSNFDWVEVTFSSSPVLQAESTYWLVLDTSANSSNFWTWQNDVAQSYTRGLAKWSSSWQAGNPTWNVILGDLIFQTYIGGTITYLDGGNDFTVSGDLHANTIKNADIEKGAYYKSIENVTAASYNPGSEDPSPKVFPISEGQIAAWKQQAEQADVITGDITSCPSTLGPGKIVGSIDLNIGCEISVRTPVWVTGDFTVNNNNRFVLSSEYGDSSGAMIVDGITTFNNNNVFIGTSSTNSILMLLSTYDSRSSGVSAIKLNNSGNSSFLYASKGIIEPGNGNDFKELTGWKIKLTNNSNISYETGLAGAFFSAGPSGSYSLVKGTYQLK